MFGSGGVDSFDISGDFGLQPVFSWGAMRYRVSSRSCLNRSESRGVFSRDFFSRNFSNQSHSNLLIRCFTLLGIIDKPILENI